MKLPALTGRALGLVLIFLTAIIWVAASFVSQLLVTQQEGRTNFNVPPFLLTYLSTSIFTVFLPMVQLKSLLQETWLLRRSFKYKPLGDDEESAPITAAAAAADMDASSSSPSCHAAAGGGLGGLTADLEAAEAAAAAEAASKAVRASRNAHKESFTAAAQCFLLWFVAQFLFNQSLSLTSVTSNTILSSTSSLFTFALSMVFLREPYSVAKLASITACIGGTLLVTLSDESSSSSTSSVRSSSLAAAVAGSNATAPAAAAVPGSSSGPSHSVWGDLLCLVSAAFYACYTIVLRKALPDDDEANVALFFGYVGLLCSVVFAPVVAVLAGVGALHLKTIPSKAYLIILVQGILNYCLSDYLWAHAVLLLGPTIATLGLSVQIPVAAVVEAIIGHPKWLSTGAAMAMTLSGTALIMAGFVAGNLAGGGHVYGSHHREDMDDVERLDQQCRSPGGLQDDSFTDHRRNAPPAPLNGTTHHTNQHNGNVFRPQGPVDSGSDSDGEGSTPHSPFLHNSRQHERQHFASLGEGFSIPVSTHASTARPHGSSPGASGGGSPSRRSTAAARDAAGAAGADGCLAGSSSNSRTPRAAAKGAGQLLMGSPPRQQQQQQAAAGGSPRQRQQQGSQQWESIELSSSPFSSDRKSGELEGSPSALAGLRPKEQLPQRSPLGAVSAVGEGSSVSAVGEGSSKSLQAGQAPAAGLQQQVTVAGAAAADLLGLEEGLQSQLQQG